MRYKLFIKNLALIISILLIGINLFEIPYISGLVQNSDKVFEVRILRLFAFIYIIWYVVSFLRMKNLIKIILVILAVLSSEIYLQYKSQVSSEENQTTVADQIVTKDEKLGWIWIPNSKKINNINGKTFRISFNSYGLRGSEESLSNKILFLGNSVAQAQHVPEKETFVYLSNGINAGFDGYDTYMQRDRFKRDLHKLDVDKLVLVVNVADIYSLVSSKNKIANALKSNTDLQNNNLLKKKINQIKLIDFISLIKIQNEKITQIENIEERDNEYRNLHSAIQSPKVWDEWTNSILDIKNNFDGKFYIVLTVPRSIYRDNQKKEYKYWLNKELKKFCSQNNIVFIDTLDYLKNRKDDLYLDYMHFNTNGHAKIAEILKVLL